MANSSRSTLVVHGRLAMREARLAAARGVCHGLQIMSFEQAAVRLAGRFARPIDEESLRAANLTADWLGGGKDHRLDPQHPFPPAQIRRQVLELTIKEMFVSRIQVRSSSGFRCARPRHGHNPNIRNEVRPESSRTAPKFSSRSNSRVAAQRERLLPGAEAGKASSSSSF